MEPAEPNVKSGTSSKVPEEKTGLLLRRMIELTGAALFVGMLFLQPPAGMPSPAYRLAAVTVLMAALWLTEIIPIAVTALIPLAAYPLLGIATSDAIGKTYLDKNIFLFLGGFIIALGIEKWGLHRRMALHIVQQIGFSPRRIVFGFMASTGFLSMWISNTASTMLMLPIGLALLAALSDVFDENNSAHATNRVEQRVLDQLAVAMLLGIAYSASLGGLSTTVGTPTNVTMLGIWETRSELVAEYGTLSMGTWLASFFPLSLMMILAAWQILTSGIPPLPHAENLGRSFFRERLQQLGKPTREEWIVLAIFVLTAGLWIFRSPLTFGERTILPGWGPIVKTFLLDHLDAGPAFENGLPIHDSTVAILMAILLFFLPARPDRSGHSRRLMDWETVQHRVPWGILLLIGGGLAMAEAFQSTGLSQWIGTRLVDQAASAPVWVLVASVCVLMTFLTEFTSNIATVSTLVPVLIDAALELDMDPRLIMIPATISASCAFMLPIATPPNAIVFSSGRIAMRQMVKYGILLNLAGVLFVTLATFLLFKPIAGIP